MAHPYKDIHECKECVTTPRPKGLILTHILQMDFVKWPIKPSRMAECITTSPISFRSTSEPKKMWVRIRSLDRGGMARSFHVAIAIASMNRSTEAIADPLYSVLFRSDVK